MVGPGTRPTAQASRVIRPSSAKLWHRGSGPAPERLTGGRPHVAAPHAPSVQTQEHAGKGALSFRPPGVVRPEPLEELAQLGGVSLA